MVGFEGDYTWFGDRHSAANLPITSGGASNGANYVTRLDQTSGLASVRARLGYAFDKTLLYGTAGAAWLRTSVFGESAAGACLGICDAVATFDDWGAVVGGGAEYAITPNIVLRAEYLYYFLGRSHSVVAACPAAGCAAFSDTPHTYTWRTQDVQQARVGVSWKFGGPVVAKY